MRFPRLGFAADTARTVEAVRDTVTASMPPDPSTYPLTSPWSTNQLQQVLFSDVFGPGVAINTRSSAMRLPALARGRNRMVATAAKLPLVVRENGGGPASDVTVSPAPSWLTQTGDGSSPQARLAWTVDDLIFYGWSCWWRTVDPNTGELVAASRINQDEWTINADMRVEVDGVERDASEVIVIPGFHEGILSFGADVLGDARALYSAVRARLASPLPGVDLHQTGGTPLTDTEIDELIARWVAARNGANAGVGYTSEMIEAKPFDGMDAQLMIEARNATSVDLARLVGIAAAAVDASNAGASLTYETATGRNQEFLDLDLDLYLVPIAARLSLDDVVAPGRYVTFDTGAATAPVTPPTGPDLED